MSKCHVCRDKEAELLTVWERLRNWVFVRGNYAFFPHDFDELRSEKYTQGYSDGYVAGTERQKMYMEEQLKRNGF